MNVLMILTIADAPSCAIIPLDPTSVIVVADMFWITQTTPLVKVHMHAMHYRDNYEKCTGVGSMGAPGAGWCTHEISATMEYTHSLDFLHMAMKASQSFQHDKLVMVLSLGI